MDGKQAADIRQQWQEIEERLGCELNILCNGEFFVSHQGDIFHTGVVDDPYIQERAMQAAIAEFKDKERTE